MAVGQRLGNGYIVLLMTPREATCVSDELLHPEGFPWQSTENQMTALEVRSTLRQLVVEDSADRLGEAAHAMEAALRQAEQERMQRETQEGP